VINPDMTIDRHSESAPESPMMNTRVMLLILVTAFFIVMWRSDTRHDVPAVSARVHPPTLAGRQARIAASRAASSRLRPTFVRFASRVRKISSPQLTLVSHEAVEDEADLSWECFPDGCWASSEDGADAWEPVAAPKPTRQVAIPVVAVHPIDVPVVAVRPFDVQVVAMPPQDMPVVAVRPFDVPVVAMRPQIARGVNLADEISLDHLWLFGSCGLPPQAEDGLPINLPALAENDRNRDAEQFDPCPSVSDLEFHGVLCEQPHGDFTSLGDNWLHSSDSQDCELVMDSAGRAESIEGESLWKTLTTGAPAKIHVAVWSCERLVEALGFWQFRAPHVADMLVDDRPVVARRPKLNELNEHAPARVSVRDGEKRSVR
jgi:hypothetical protein